MTAMAVLVSVMQELMASIVLKLVQDQIHTASLALPAYSVPGRLLQQFVMSGAMRQLKSPSVC